MKKAQWVKDCWDYHSQYISELDVAVDWTLRESEVDRCWCCGHKAKLQKCHIIAKSLGGEDVASNLIPLCALCHDKAPDVAEKTEIFRWIAVQQNPLSGLGLGRYWHLYNVIVSRVIQPGIEIDLTKFEKCMDKAHLSIGYHYSQSNTGIQIKESSREWMLNKAFDFYEQESK